MQDTNAGTVSLVQRIGINSCLSTLQRNASTKSIFNCEAPTSGYIFLQTCRQLTSKLALESKLHSNTKDITAQTLHYSMS